MKNADSVRKRSPERFSGHNLTDYLIANPDARGNFKWHTLRSCMWTRLLVKCPQFASWCDFSKITRKDAKIIVQAQCHLVSRFPKERFSPWDWAELIAVHPELADQCDLNRLNGHCWRLILKNQPSLASRCSLKKFTVYDWRELLPIHPEFMDLCPWDEFSGFCWSQLLQARSEFADRCPWEKLNFSNWRFLLRKKPRFMSNFTLEMYPGPDRFAELLEMCCTGENALPHGMFENFTGDPAAFLVFRTMDKVNAGKYLRRCYDAPDWDFLEKLCDISREELLNVPVRKQVPFLITLKAPESLFRKFIPSVDPAARDRTGNTLLHYAVTHDFCKGASDMRYPLLLDMGCDPDAKNDAGFSSNDLIRKNEKISTFLR